MLKKAKFYFETCIHIYYCLSFVTAINLIWVQKGRAKKNKNGENFHRGEEVKPVTNFFLLEKKGCLK